MQVIRTRNSASLHLPLCVANAINVTCWLSYGVVRSQLPACNMPRDASHNCTCQAYEQRKLKMLGSMLSARLASWAAQPVIQCPQPTAAAAKHMPPRSSQLMLTGIYNVQAAGLPFIYVPECAGAALAASALILRLVVPQ